MRVRTSDIRVALDAFKSQVCQLARKQRGTANKEKSIPQEADHKRDDSTALPGRPAGLLFLRAA
jgi:hypothetical protein